MEESLQSDQLISQSDSLTPSEGGKLKETNDGVLIEKSEDSHSKNEDSGLDKLASGDCNMDVDVPIPETNGGDSNGSTSLPSLPRETVDFKVIFNKQKYDVMFALDDSFDSLKGHIETLTGVPATMQTVLYKGVKVQKQGVTLRELQVTSGAKLMVIGSTANDIKAIAPPDPKALQDEERKEASSGKEPLCKQKQHKTVLDKFGKPDDVMVGIKNCQEPLPPHPLAGMYNKSGGKVRLTFKMEADQVWIGTKERTEKLGMNSIKAVVGEPIEGHEDYHMMALQLGPTEASQYWIYWVPSQYMEAIKDAILGKWQFPSLSR